MNHLNNIKCFLLDMDGTIYLSDTIIDGALSAVNRMQKQGRVIFLTNNSSATSKFYYQKLTRLGFSVAPSDIYSSADATIDYLNTNYKDYKTYLLGTAELKTEFIERGINLCADCNDDLKQSKNNAGAHNDFYDCDSSNSAAESGFIGSNCCRNKNYTPDIKQNLTLECSDSSACHNLAKIAVLSFDKTLSYKKLETFCRLIKNGAVYVATHPDKTCPTINGDIPDIGSFIKLIECATGRKPDVICGKPSKEYGRRILSMTGLKPHQIAMVGDRLYTDIRFAYNCGFKSVLVLSGETKAADLDGQKRRPDIVINSVADWDK